MKNVEERSFIVYKHTNKINGKIYIGITSTTIKKRSGSNGINYKSNKHFYSAIKKYNWNNFKHEILFENLSKEQACKIEQQLIKQYQSTDSNFGYNHSIGGELSALGCTRIQTLETIEKIKANVNSKKPIICLNTLKIFNSIHECAEQMNLDFRYISRVLNGQAKSCHGYHFIYLKDYDKNKKYDLFKREKRIICIETGQIFESISSCAKEMNLSKGTISHVINGKRKTYHNLHFEYLGDRND